MSHKFGITGLFNERKHGKTTYAVKELLMKVNSGEYEEGYSNIHIGPRIKMENGREIHFGHPKIHFIDYAQWRALECPTRNGEATALVLIDQLPNYLDSRKSNSKLNIETSRMFRESRQHGWDSIYTTWAKSEVDRRVRPFTDLIVGAYRTKSGFLYKRVVRESGRRLPNVRIPWTMARAVWTYFDSTELIKDETIIEFESTKRIPQTIKVKNV